MERLSWVIWVDSSVITKVLTIKKRKEESQQLRVCDDRAEGGVRKWLALGVEREHKPGTLPSLEGAGNKEWIPL